MGVDITSEFTLTLPPKLTCLSCLALPLPRHASPPSHPPAALPPLLPPRDLQGGAAGPHRLGRCPHSAAGVQAPAGGAAGAAGRGRSGAGRGVCGRGVAGGGPGVVGIDGAFVCCLHVYCTQKWDDVLCSEPSAFLLFTPPPPALCLCFRRACCCGAPSRARLTASRSSTCPSACRRSAKHVSAGPPWLGDGGAANCRTEPRLHCAALHMLYRPCVAELSSNPT